MATTKTEAEATPRNGPEIKDVEVSNTNGVDGSRENEMSNSTSNGPSSAPVSNNGSHETNDGGKLQQGGYYKPPPPPPSMGYPGADAPSAATAVGYDGNIHQPAYGYPPHGYMQHQQQPHHQPQQPGDVQNNYPYPQYPGSHQVRNVSSPVASKPMAYMNSMPRTGSGPVLSYPPAQPHAGQGYSPSRYPTPTLNQLLQPQPGTTTPVHRYPYGDYSQQQPQQQHPPNMQTGNWPMQQQQQSRNYSPSPGFKSPPNSMQQGGTGVGYPPYGATNAIAPGSNIQQQQHPSLPGPPQQQRYTLATTGGLQPPTPPSPGHPQQQQQQQHQQQQETNKNSSGGETSTELTSSAAIPNNHSPSTTAPSSEAAASAAAATTATTSVATATATTSTSSSVAAATTTAASNQPTVTSSTSTTTASTSSSNPSSSNSNGGSLSNLTPATSAAAASVTAGSSSDSSSPALGSGGAGNRHETPSPANRSMSPALGPSNTNNASPNPVAGQTDNNSASARISSPMAAQGAYQQPMPPPPHGMPPYKMSGPPYQQQQQSGPPHQPQYLPNQMYMQQHPRPPMGGAASGPNPYGPPGPYGPPQQQQQQPGVGLPPNSTNSPMPPASPGPNRPMPPHMGPPTPYSGYPSGPPNMNQYGQQQQQQQQQQPPPPNWGPVNNGPPNSPMSGPGGKGGPPTLPSGQPAPGPRPPGPPHTPPHYMKQHLQHHLQQQQHQKLYGMAPSPGPVPPSSQAPTLHSQPQQQHVGPYPPSSVNNAVHPPSAASPVTNLVTTGPDGVAGLDEASQQSTLSNTSAASGDDSSAPSTPRSRKETGPMTMTTSTLHPTFSQQPQQQQHSHHPHMLSHPATPQSTAPSPGAASMSSQHEEFSDVHSPGPAGTGNWSVSTRPTPSSPVRNTKSHTSDALQRMYDFDDHPDRRKFLDQLLRFMEEKGSPITACPTISKNPLDLFRLYLLVRERGGFLEVTKNKSWKDIAQTLGIGASSSAAYTLRKHYTKSLFPWECKFDRGGVDPQPILNQVEASTKKKTPANKAISVPSPAGSSNSQDSFPSSGVPPMPTMDGYSNYQSGGYPPPHTGENIAASNPFDDQQHYANRGGHPPYPPPPQQPPAMYNSMSGRPNYPGQNHPGQHPNHPGHPNQGYHQHPYQNEYPNPNNQQYPPYSNQPNRMYSAPYPEPFSPQAPPNAPQQGSTPGPAGPAPNDPYGRYMPPNHVPTGPFPPRPPAPTSVAQTSTSTAASAPSPSPATIATSTSGAPPSLPPAQQQPSSITQHLQQPQQQPQGSSSAGPSPAPSPAPNTTGPVYPEQNDQFQQRSGLRQLLATSTLAQQLATPSPDRLPGYQPGASATTLGPPPGQPYPGLIRPGTPGPVPSGSIPPGMPSRQTTPTPVATGVPPAGSVGPGPNAPITPGAPIQPQQQQPGQQQPLGPYPQPYGPPGQAPNQQPRQPSFDPYGVYRPSYGSAVSSGDSSSGVGASGIIGNLNSGLATGWRSGAPYGNQYPQQGSPGPVQTVGAPWVPPTGTPQPRNPAWDQSQRFPGPMPGSPATPTFNGTNHQQGSATPAMPAQQQPQQWASGSPSMTNSRPPYMGPRPPYRPADGKPPYPMSPTAGKGPMPVVGPPGSSVYPPNMQPMGTGMPIYPVKRESFFPPDSIEAVGPVVSKRRRLGRADVAPVDAWRLYLALKSGLLAESSWAIDVLNVLLYDDVSIHYFSLGYMPGLLEVLLEHFRRCLAQIFTILEDMEIGYDRIEEFKAKLKQRSLTVKDEKPLEAVEAVSAAPEEEDDAWWSWPRRKSEPDHLETADLGSVKNSDLSGERVRFLDGDDWSMNTRRNEKVGIVPRENELFVIDAKKDWDIHDGFESGMEQWQIGGGDTTQHIVTHFTAELNNVPFVRVLKRVKKNVPSADSDANDSTGNQTHDAEEQTVIEKNSLTASEQSDDQLQELPKSKNCMIKKDHNIADVLHRIKKEKLTDEESTKEQEKSQHSSMESSGLSNGVPAVTESQDIKPEPTSAVTESTPTHSSKSDSRPLNGDSVNRIDLAVPSMESDPSPSETGKRLVIRDPHGTLKRRKMDDYEDECFTRDESSLYLVDDSQDSLTRRALALSNIFRSLSFVPSNETELAKNSTLLVIVGKLLLLHHDHPLRSSHQKNYDREEDVDFTSVDSLTTGSLSAGAGLGKCETDWWWDTLLLLRENVLVLMANIAGQLDLSIYSEEIVRPLIDGLLHWAICPSAQSQDPFGSFGAHSTSLLSPQRLSLEALCKLLVMDTNMDLILATPPFSRLEKLVHFLTRSLCRTEDQVLREFAINLLYYLSAADSGMARLIALHNNSLALLVSFVEQAEANALAVASQHGIQALRENPESMGTSLDMLRRAASTLFHVSRHPDSRPLLAKLEQRLLALVMSQIMDQSVAALLSKSLYLCNSSDE